MTVEFTEEANLYNQNMSKSKVHGDRLVRWLIKIKLVSTEKQAKGVLIAISILFLLVTAGLYGYYLLGIGNPVQIRYSVPEQFKMQMKDAQKTLENK